jgi:hypothetical protein
VAVHTELTSENLIITLTGVDALWALKKRLVINRQQIVSAKVMGRKDAIKLLRLRLWGSYLPGVVCAGTFSVSKRAGLLQGSRAFCSMYRAKQVLVITTSKTRPALVVLEVADLFGLAQQLGVTRTC